MIPRKIHFCWLSGDEYPALIRHCIDTWHKVLPDYEIVLWDTKRFDIDSVSWVKEAFEAKKYAFAADYIRFYSVYTEGGIYLDSDVEVLKSFNPLLKNKSFIGFEASTGNVEAAIFGAEAGCNWCKEVLDFYEDKHFKLDSAGKISLEYIAPNIVGGVLKSVFPDFPQAIPQTEVLVGNQELLVCPDSYFSPLQYDLEKSRGGEKKVSNKYLNNPNTYCIHRFTAAWGATPSRFVQYWEVLKRNIVKVIGEKCFSVLMFPLRLFRKSK